ncbi:MAG: hypothetical protein HJJLKODD_00483 [Phycisphaerae bacterium]|nr:hypothetical protein [Phycisphaerae bacterium]
MTTMLSKPMTPRVQARVRDLQRVMNSLIEQYRRLLEVLQAKLQAMRQSHTEAMQQWVEQENNLTRQIQQTEGLWRQLLGATGRDLGISEVQVSRLSLSGLAPYIDSQRLATLRGLGVQLSQVAREVSKVNTVIKMVGQEILHHYRWIFQQLTSNLDDSGVYSPIRGTRTALRPQMVDATG